MEIKLAGEKQLEKWDTFVDASVNGTIFHKRRFLAYHKDKFAGREHYLLVLKGDEAFAQISFATSVDEEGLLCGSSPYGASYGGFVFCKSPSYQEGKEAVSLLIDYLRENGIHRFTLRQPPDLFCKSPMGLFIFNLLEAGFVTVNREIFNVVLFNENIRVMDQLKSSVRTQIRKAEQFGLRVDEKAPLSDVYPLIERTIGKFGERPTHSREELQWLSDEFPDEISFCAAYHEGVPIVAVTNFILTPDVASSFYLSTDERYIKMNALRFIVGHVLQRTQDRGFAAYDFGTSTSGLQANEGLLHFKEQFSNGTLFRETLEWTHKQ
jgi:hypothetical protein